MIRPNEFITSQTTMGAEVEFENVAPTAFEGFNALQYDLHDDGSTRTPTYTIGDTIAVIPHTFRDNRQFVASGVIRNSHNYGMELVTRPMTIADALESGGLALLSKHLKHIKSTVRTSIHIHIDVANRPWTYVQNAILWAHHLEAVLYRLAAGGRHHRGEYNDYKFCRPLSNPIGAFWGSNARKARPLILMDKINEAQSMTQLLAAWGRLDHLSQPSHYIPHRLHMVNLASVLRQGTLEWRLFDALYQHLATFVEIVASVHSLAALGPPPTICYPLGSAPDLSMRDVSDMLQVDVSRLWGNRWQNMPEGTFIAPHYDGGRVPRFPAFDEDLYTLSHDNGTQTCTLFRR